MEPDRGKRSIDMGPQYAKDSEFAAKMRRHQSWYRTRVLQVPCGVGPFKNSKHLYGNMLTEEHGTAGMNFLNYDIYRIARQRYDERRGLIDEHRLFHNMMSSQPMCFNLFGMLSKDINLATLLFLKLLPNEIKEVTRVLFEHFPEPKNEYLADDTAFDAYVEYVDTRGHRSFIGIETKLTEPFSQDKVYDGEKYRRWMRAEVSPWNKDAGGKVADIKHNQLWRDHLLAIAIANHANSKFYKGRLMLVRHPQDEECASIVSEYNKLLNPTDDSFIDMPLNGLVNAWREFAVKEEYQVWLDQFRLRYLDLDISDFALQYEKSLATGDLRCSICLSPIGGEMNVYPYPVCYVCDERALNSSNLPAKQYFVCEEKRPKRCDEEIIISDAADDGDNPVFIDGIKCWRRYRFGGWITMRDVFYCRSIEEFYKMTSFQ